MSLYPKDEITDGSDTCRLHPNGETEDGGEAMKENAVSEACYRAGFSTLRRTCQAFQGDVRRVAIAVFLRNYVM